MRFARAVVVVGVLVGGFIVGSAGPAVAHGSGGVGPTNYETHIDAVTPPLGRSIAIRVVDLGSRIELRNRSRATVVVLGYDDEPFLRIGPDGVFENRRSPATYLNRERTPSSTVPAIADPTAKPRWAKVSDGVTARWHDHRAHWMGSSDPPSVSRDPARRQVVMRDWEVPLRVGEQDAVIRGDVVWLPPPSPWPWLVGSAVVAAIVIAASRTRRCRAVLSVGLILLLASEIVHLAGQWGATTSSAIGKVGTSAYSLLGCALAIVALIQLARRRDPDASTPIVLIAAMVLAISGGLADISALTRSELVFTGPEWLGRATVAATLGLGVGLMVAAGLRIRTPRARQEPSHPAPSSPPASASRAGAGSGRPTG